MKLLFENWRGFLIESKLRVFDFDDTLATTDALVILTLADGSTTEQTPAEFAVYELGPGESYGPDAFVQFNNVSDPREIKQVTNILRNVVAAGNEDRHAAILTARPHGAGTGIAKFLEDIGISAESVEIITLASSLPEDKRRWVQDRIEQGATDVEFFDDSQKNIDAVESLRDQYPSVRLRTRLIKYTAPPIPVP
jgi:hypothetical protein